MSGGGLSEAEGRVMRALSWAAVLVIFAAVIAACVAGAGLVVAALYQAGRTLGWW